MRSRGILRKGDKYNFYDIFDLPCFKKTVKNMKIILKVMHENGYIYWGIGHPTK